MSGSVTCVLADDHPPVLEFLARFLGKQGITITASTRDGEEALRKIGQTRPAVAVVDARMPQLSGLEVIRAVVASGLPTRMVLYTGYSSGAMLMDALDAGARGLVDKGAPPEDVARAIRIVAAGETYLDPGLSAALAGGPGAARAPRLTPRERDVLRLLADGFSNEQIGERLAISGQTVRTHVQKAMDRLGAATRTQAVATALRASLIA